MITLHTVYYIKNIHELLYTQNHRCMELTKIVIRKYAWYLWDDDVLYQLQKK